MLTTRVAPICSSAVLGLLLAALAEPSAAQDRLPWLRDEPRGAPSLERSVEVDRDNLPPPSGGSSAPRAGAPDTGTFTGGGGYSSGGSAAGSYGGGGYDSNRDVYRPPASRYEAPPPPAAAYDPPPRPVEAYREGPRDAYRNDRNRDDRYRNDGYRADPDWRDAPPPRHAHAAPPPYRGDWRDEPPPRDGTYSMREIVDAGHGFFGSISQGLASVIEHAFKTKGRPNGYILGEDVGGAFVAGLRYGEGRLFTRDAGTHKVFWQGPSVGYDAGAEGSRVMVLVYGLRDPADIYQRFGGVAGSAYVVGGVGLTFQQRDDIVLAPIRAGLGLRLGANVGYLKYTRRPTWNPF